MQRKAQPSFRNAGLIGPQPPWRLFRVAVCQHQQEHGKNREDQRQKRARHFFHRLPLARTSLDDWNVSNGYARRQLRVNLDKSRLGVPTGPCILNNCAPYGDHIVNRELVSLQSDLRTEANLQCVVQERRIRSIADPIAGEFGAQQELTSGNARDGIILSYSDTVRFNPLPRLCISSPMPRSVAHPSKTKTTKSKAERSNILSFIFDSEADRFLID